MKTLLVEHPSYMTLLSRKTRIHKMIESVFFVIIVIAMIILYGYSSSFFKYGVFASAILVLLLSPIVYKIVVQPQFTLTETELIIEKRNRKMRFSLAKIEDAYDLRYIFQINEKKKY
ncbi:hypothetical protein [Tepidibacillus marianensis]|uniref:hypothetical protein n=1 Tax=Tepidibacillus marianensis TaxID=3131995 RepID=UPI0030D3B294